MSDIYFNQFSFAPVIRMPEGYEIYDFSQGYDPNRARRSDYGIGRYNEKRPGMYTTALFTSEELRSVRDIHVGIDLAAPVDTAVHAFYDGVVHLAGVNPAPGDYGGTLITEHRLGDRLIWALHGHLSHASIAGRVPGTRVMKGEIIARVGDKHENGGWNPHLHFQLSWKKPERCDLPGAVAERDLAEALETYPDPRLVLGPLY